MKLFDQLTNDWYLPYVGKIKTGTKEWRNGKSIPVKYNYFVIFSVAKQGKLEHQLHPVFNQIYNKKKGIPITFPSDNIEDIFEVHYAVYKGSKPICKGDGEKYERDFNGQKTTGVCDYNNCQFAKQNGCKMKMSLKVLIRNKETGKVFTGGYFSFYSSGFKTIKTIAKNLSMAKSVFGYLSGIPAYLMMDNDSTKLQNGGKEFISEYHYERIDFEMPLEALKGKQLTIKYEGNEIGNSDEYEEDFNQGYDNNYNQQPANNYNQNYNNYQQQYNYNQQPPVTNPGYEQGYDWQNNQQPQQNKQKPKQQVRTNQNTKIESQFDIQEEDPYTNKLPDLDEDPFADIESDI